MTTGGHKIKLSHAYEFNQRLGGFGKLDYTDQLNVGNTQHRYQVVRLWEQDSAPLLATPALLPFAALARTDSPATLLEQVAAQIDMIEEPDEQRNISACVEVLASLRFDKDFIQRFLREELMRESPIWL